MASATFASLRGMACLVRWHDLSLPVLYDVAPYSQGPGTRGGGRTPRHSHSLSPSSSLFFLLRREVEHPSDLLFVFCVSYLHSWVGLLPATGGAAVQTGILEKNSLKCLESITKNQTLIQDISEANGINYAKNVQTTAKWKVALKRINVLGMRQPPPHWRAPRFRHLMRYIAYHVQGLMDGISHRDHSVPAPALFPWPRPRDLTVVEMSRPPAPAPSGMGSRGHALATSPSCSAPDATFFPRPESTKFRSLHLYPTEAKESALIRIGSADLSQFVPSTVETRGKSS
ncbi:hypothetical protein Zm00014a_007061 [Zea mays]|uniref:Uncharacterized protein n=1 Tax=Zea mays TaxID=4577 RepID=A0A317YBQ4_MAIZE|nr:hypothetical protein Zm00014a_007061 [Zea mays]